MIKSNLLDEWETPQENLNALRQKNIASVRSLLAPPPRVPGSEWSNKHIVLATEGGATEPGYYRWQRQPFQREVMDVLTDRTTQEVVLMWGVRSGKTTLMQNTTAYYTLAEPSQILWVLPTETKAKEISSTNIDSLFTYSPKLKGLLREKRSRDGGNNVLMKKFDGGYIMFTGATASTGLKATTIRVLLADEISAYPHVLKDEGSPLELAKDRTISYGHRKKHVYSSTPTIKDFCAIEREFLKSDQRYYFVPCPKCQHMQKLVWKQLVFTDDPKNPLYVCENEDCGYGIPEAKKMGMLEKGEWRKTNPDSDMAGFHLNSLYSTTVLWSDLVKKWKQAKNDNGLLQAFINSYLAETFDLSGTHVTTNQLEARLEHYPAQAPDGVGVITMGVDVQDNRLEALVVGWGANDVGWVLDSQVFDGDTSRDDVWRELQDFVLTTRYRTKAGVGVAIRAIAVDSKFNTNKVYTFIDDFRRTSPPSRVAIATQGSPKEPRVIADRPKQSQQYGALFYTVGVNVIKEHLSNILNNDAPDSSYLHLPITLPSPDNHKRWLDREVLDQLTAEKLVTTWKGNQVVREWKAIRKRNEAWDCLVYAYAVLHHLGPEVRQSLGEMALKLSQMAPDASDKPSHNSDTPPVLPEGTNQPRRDVRVHQPRRQLGGGIPRGTWR